jgi:hypothetical protein
MRIFRMQVRRTVAVLVGLLSVAGVLAVVEGCQPPPAGGGGTGNSGLTGDYVGSQTCRLCHTRIHDAWQETLHAEALETLEAIGQGDNPACVGCHTVGFGEPGGFVDRATTNALAEVGCEDCHGPGSDHIHNVSDESLRPPRDIRAAVCGRCHQGSHHPNYEQWQESAHAEIPAHVAEDFTDGTSLNSCGPCHSGDFRLLAVINDETVPDNLLAGVDPSDMNPVTCAICHYPHGRTGNAVNPDPGRDFQLRYPEVANPTPSKTISDNTDPDRYNACGQCHHSRGRTWDAGDRPPHHSLQANVYVGEMPVPAGTASLVPFQRSVHAFVPAQCATCHMFRRDYHDEQAPAISGHTFQIDFRGCTAATCHPSAAMAEADKEALQADVQGRLDDIAARLGDPATWEYTSNDGPDEDGQDLLSDEIKQIRFLYYYVLNDGSRGVHNPFYVNDILSKAEDLLTGEGL